MTRRRIAIGLALATPDARGFTLLETLVALAIVAINRTGVGIARDGRDRAVHRSPARAHPGELGRAEPPGNARATAAWPEIGSTAAKPSRAAHEDALGGESERHASALFGVSTCACSTRAAHPSPP